MNDSLGPPRSPGQTDAARRGGDPAVPVGSRIVFGAMSRRPDTSADDRERLARRAIEVGLTTIDAAPLYEFGDSERWVGRAIRGQRDRVILATKVGLRWEDAVGDVLFSFVDSAGRLRTVRKDSRPSSIRADVEGSLTRLGVDVLDLVQIHHPDPRTPLEDSLDALLRLRDEGKLRGIGLSNFDLAATERCRQLLGTVPLACLQLPHSLLDRWIERDRLPWARRWGVPVWAYSPLAEGVLAKDVSFSHGSGSWMRHAANEAAIRDFVTRHLDPLAARHRVSRAAVALAWLASRDGVHPIVGVSQASHLDAAADALQLQLSSEERARLDEASSAGGWSRRAGSRRRDRLWSGLTRQVDRVKRRFS